MPALYMMIGLPACGKSYLIDKWLRGLIVPNGYIASSDAYIESVAITEGKTYNEVFQDAIKEANKHAQEMAYLAILRDVSVIWDQTNLAPSARANRLKNFPSHYEKYGVYVYCSDEELWLKRLNSRLGKNIPDHVIEFMKKSFVPPILEEGFSQIWAIDTAQKVEQVCLCGQTEPSLGFPCSHGGCRFIDTLEYVVDGTQRCTAYLDYGINTESVVEVQR